jgi:hypothetical protein
MRLFWKFVIGFFAVTGAVVLATGLLDIQFGHSNFWDHHGILFLISIAIFPRLTLLFSSVATGGLIWWLSWVFAPRILVAALATITYWYQNPILVVIAWLVAFSGESSEKYAVVQKSGYSNHVQKGFRSAKWVDSETKQG